MTIEKDDEKRGEDADTKTGGKAWYTDSNSNDAGSANVGNRSSYSSAKIIPRAKQNEAESPSSPTRQMTTTATSTNAALVPSENLVGMASIEEVLAWMTTLPNSNQG